MDAVVEDREHRLIKPGQGFGLGEHSILSPVLLTRDEAQSALTVNGTISTDCKRDRI